MAFQPIRTTLGAPALPHAVLGRFTSRPGLLQTCAELVTRPITITIPWSLGDVWESVLRAVPKKKTSYSKKRSRFLAGKALKDVTTLNKCPGCGRVKRAHTLCVYCVYDVKQVFKQQAMMAKNKVTSLFKGKSEAAVETTKTGGSSAEGSS